MVEEGVSSMVLFENKKNLCFIFSTLLWSLFTWYRYLLHCYNLKATSDGSSNR